MTHPYTPETHPDWAIEEALLRQIYTCDVAYVKMNPGSCRHILAHAYDIARHEKPLVDKAALILADYLVGIWRPTDAGAIRNGRLLHLCDALRAAMLKNGIEI